MVPLAKFYICILPRFGAILYRKLAEVFFDFFLNFSCAHKHIVVHTKNYGKTRKTKGTYRKTRTLRRREGRSRISLLCTIVEKNVNDSQDFRLYLWSAVNVRKTVEYCRNISFVVVQLSCMEHYGMPNLTNHNNDTIRAADVDELVDFSCS